MGARGGLQCPESEQGTPNHTRALSRCPMMAGAGNSRENTCLRSLCPSTVLLPIAHNFEKFCGVHALQRGVHAQLSGRGQEATSPARSVRRRAVAERRAAARACKRRLRRALRSMDAQQLVAALGACMSPDDATRKAAEEALKQVGAGREGGVNTGSKFERYFLLFKAVCARLDARWVKWRRRDAVQGPRVRAVRGGAARDR